jgi:hypothetical protein
LDVRPNRCSVDAFPGEPVAELSQTSDETSSFASPAHAEFAHLIGTFRSLV